ncbi:glycosyltransferase family 39 protein [Frankia sp. AgB32]|uniref:glycosyltransferase family 39 protein n=1 Tax=Frankia sp. AgB32 TaxID=631119 RepID=UPI00200D2982|nr:glycosyltransferase family 39 protein [Frankia sp. AgB32]MCK9893715.1 glycosyltransferase family 39 protein [Frankia sp. AgB32]
MSAQTLEIPRRTGSRDTTAPGGTAPGTTAPGTTTPGTTARAPGVGAHRRRRRGHLLGLPAVLAVQVAMSIRLSATAFQDEALYLDAGRQILDSWRHGTPVSEDFGSYFSGSPYVYPPLGALAEAAGGLGGARLLSLVCCVLTTVLLASVSRSLFGPGAAVPGAAAFVLSGPVLFVGHFATYDAMALMLLVGGLALGLRAGRSSSGSRAAVLALTAGFLAAGAVVTKYVSALFVPSAVLVVLLWGCREAGSPPAAGGQARRRRLVLAAGSVAGAGLAVGSWLALTGTDQLEGLVTTTLSRRVVGPTSSVEVACRGLAWAAPTLLVALLGVVLVGRRRPALTVLLVGSAVLPIAFQARSGELTSLHKHVAFGLVFAAPLAGAGITAALDRWELRDPGRPLTPRLLALPLVAVLLLAAGMRSSQQLDDAWADSRPLTDLLRTQVRFGSGHYLVEESEVPRYYMENLTAPWQWSGTYFLYYRQPGRKLAYTGTAAFRHALSDQYFDIVVLRFGPTADLDWKVHDILGDQRKYRQIARLPEPGGWTIWRRVDR